MIRRALCWLNPWGHLWDGQAALRCRRCGTPYDRVKHCRGVR